MRPLSDTFLRLARCLVWSPGLRDAIENRCVRDYYAFKRHYREHFAEEDRGPFPVKLAFTAICKNEGRYLKEWLDYHRLIGVERFYIYDNGSTDDTRAVLEPYIQAGTVVYTPWPGIRQQLAAYNDSLRRHRLETEWMGFIDLDEFVVPVAAGTVPEILARFRGEPGLNIHWVTYGDSGHKTRTPGYVIERFTMRAAEPNDITKAIVNPRAAFFMDNHHGCFIGSASAVNELGVCVRTCTPRKSVRLIRINHYWGKSWEEYLEKCAKGRARSHTNLTPDSGAFADHNKNEVRDPIMEKYVRQLGRPEK